jgi:glycosyltransferase involved in cell wall biosynthesis
MTADIVIPIGPYHASIAREAVNSARAQTVLCNVIPVEDTEGRGAAWTRNEGVRRGSNPFIVFLDADDILHPRFVERTLQDYSERTYVYTDWRTHDDKVRFAVDKTNFFKVGMYHIITTLLPRSAFEAVGGFNEGILALEDEDLYYRLQIAGICGVRCPEPLVWYRRQLGRGTVNSEYHGIAKRDAAIETMDAYFYKRYGHYRRLTNMCNCSKKKVPPKPEGEKQEGDVLARALYSPQKEVGPVSGRKYKRTGLGYEIWIDPRDAEARPDKWEVIPEIETPSVDDVRNMALRAMR